MCRFCIFKMFIIAVVLIGLYACKGSVTVYPKIKGVDGNDDNGISDGLKHGIIYVINGSGFGQKNPAEPVLFDDFESGTVGEEIFGFQGSPWTGQYGYPGYAPAVYDDSFSDDGRAMVAKFEHRVGANITTLLFNFTPTGKWFLDAELKMSFLTDNENPPYANNIKVSRLRRQSNPSISIYPSFQGMGSCDSTGWTGGGLGVDNNAAVHECYNEPYSHNTWSPKPSGWQNLSPNWLSLQWLLGDGIPGAQSYTVWVTMNCEIKMDWNDMCIMETGGSDYDQLAVGHQAADGPYGDCPQHTASSFTFWDHVYFDTAWQRIEIGDKEVYGECTERTIQIPKSWTNTKIEFEARTNQFNSGQKAWIFVVNENNVPSNGSEIKIN